MCLVDLVGSMQEEGTVATVSPSVEVDAELAPSSAIPMAAAMIQHHESTPHLRVVSAAATGPDAEPVATAFTSIDDFSLSMSSGEVKAFGTHFRYSATTPQDLTSDHIPSSLGTSRTPLILRNTSAGKRTSNNEMTLSPRHKHVASTDSVLRPVVTPISPSPRVTSPRAKSTSPRGTQVNEVARLLRNSKEFSGLLTAGAEERTKTSQSSGPQDSSNPTLAADVPGALTVLGVKSGKANFFGGHESSALKSVTIKSDARRPLPSRRGRVPPGHASGRASGMARASPHESSMHQLCALDDTFFASSASAPLMNIPTVMPMIPFAHDAFPARATPNVVRTTAVPATLAVPTASPRFRTPAQVEAEIASVLDALPRPATAVSGFVLPPLYQKQQIGIRSVLALGRPSNSHTSMIGLETDALDAKWTETRALLEKEAQDLAIAATSALMGADDLTVADSSTRAFVQGQMQALIQKPVTPRDSAPVTPGFVSTQVPPSFLLTHTPSSPNTFAYASSTVVCVCDCWCLAKIHACGDLGVDLR
jgi:hypothetical protein